MNHRLKKFQLAAVFLFLIALNASAWGQPSFFSEANSKYQAGDFKGAADLYQKIIASGNATSAVYYNLGNATLRLGHKGEALVYYERALRGAPRDKDLKWNIRVLQSALPDLIEESSPHWLQGWIENATAFWRLDEIGFLFTAVLAFGTLLALLNYLFPGIRGILMSLRFPVFLILLASLVLFGLKWYDTKDERVVILDKEVSAYYGPSDKEAKAFVLHEGAEGKIMDSSRDWFYVALKNKNTGWIPKTSCEII